MTRLINLLIKSSAVNSCFAIDVVVYLGREFVNHPNSIFVLAI